MKTKKTHWKKLKNPDYLGSWDFQPEEERILTISHSKIETIKAPGGREGKCAILYFEEQSKPMATSSAENAKALRMICGSPYVEDWKGFKIKIYVKPNVKAFGEIVDALRIRQQIIRQDIKKDYTEAIRKLEQCTNLEQLKSVYTSLTKSEQAGTVSIKDKLKTKLSA